MPRQLNPWSSRVRVRVENAMVLAASAPQGKPRAVGLQRAERHKAALPQQISQKSGRQDSLSGAAGRAVQQIRLGGSIPMASAGSESVSRLINSRCTGAKGMGSAANTV